jgi:hypothetical protein
VTWTKCLDTPIFAECNNFESSVTISCGTEIDDFSVAVCNDHRAEIHRVNSADCNNVVHMAPQNMSV